MPVRPLNLGLKSYKGRFVSDGAAQRTNVYVEATEEEGKAAFQHYVVPGLTQVATQSGDGCRGLFKIDDTTALWVAGSKVFSLTASFVPTLVGYMSGTGRVYMARNRKASGPQTALVSDGIRKYFEGGTLADITDADLPGPIACDALSVYILFFMSDGRFFWTDINDVTSINSLSYAEAEGRPDGLRCGRVIGNTVWLFGTDSLEHWSLTSDADRPFVRQAGTYQKVGCLSAGSVTETKDGVAWVASDRTVRLATGYDGTQISNHTVERDIEALGDNPVINGFSYTHEGHEFIVFNSSAWTWVYDVKYGVWHKEATGDAVRRTWEHAIEFGGKTLVGDATTAKLYVIDVDAHDDADELLTAEIVTPPDHAYPHDVEYNALYLDVLPGTGLNTTDPAERDPAIQVQTSRDGGKTFGNIEYLPTGQLGNFQKRIQTECLGTSDGAGYVFRFTWSSKVARAIMGAYVDAETVAA